MPHTPKQWRQQWDREKEVPLKRFLEYGDGVTTNHLLLYLWFEKHDPAAEAILCNIAGMQDEKMALQERIGAIIAGLRTPR